VPFFRITWYFEGKQGSQGIGGPSNVGWTESWYWQGDTLEQALQFGLTNAVYNNVRISFLPSIYQLTWVRVTDVLNPRASKLGSLQLFGRVNAFAGGDQPIADPAAQVTCCLLVDFTVLPGVAGPSAHHRRFLMRGLASSMILGNIANPTSWLWPRVRNFLNSIGNHEPPAVPGNFNSQYLIRVNVAGMPDVPIVNIIPNATSANFIDVTLPAGTPALAIGARVRISRVKSPRGVNREWTVFNPTGVAETYTLQRSRFPIAGAYTLGGRLVGPRYDYKPANQYLIVGMRQHKIGPPSRATRGRRRAV